MVRRLIRTCAALIVVLQPLACGSTSVSQLTSPDTVRCQATVGSIPTMPAGGGTADVPVVTERECTWTAATTTPWLRVSPSSGQGEAAVILTASANPQATTRSGSLTVNGSAVTITQAAAPCTFTVAPETVTLPPSGGTATVQLTTLVGCTWTTQAAVAWVGISPTSGSGSDEVRLTVTANTGTAARSGAATIAGRTVTVSQPSVSAPGPGPSPPPGPGPGPEPGPGCTYTLDPPTRSIKDKGGDATFMVDTGALCPWTAIPDVDWVHIKSGAIGLGPGQVKYAVDRNRSESRTGTIIVAGATHVITQESGN